MKTKNEINIEMFRIGLEVKRIRLNKGISMRILADAIGVSQSWWRLLESCKLNDIGIIRLTNIAILLGVNPRALLTADWDSRSKT